jgi:hypothetical protein
MTSSRRTLAAASLCTVFVLGASACSALGSASNSGAASQSTASASPSPTPLTGDQLVNKSMTVLGSATSLRLKGAVKDTSGNISFDMELVRGKGCTGTMGIAKQGSFKMIMIDRKLWIKPDAAFWKSAGLPSYARSEIEGKYLATTSDSKAFGSFGDFCDLAKMEKGFGSATGSGLQRGAATTVDGRSVVTVTDPSDGSRAYITDGTEPQLVRLDMTGSDGGQLEFLDYNKAASVAPPSKAATIDGSKFGF